MKSSLILILIILMVFSQVAVADSSTPHLYTVTFEERGLPYPINWSVSVGNKTYSALGNIVIYEPNGSYFFRINAVSGYSTGQYNYELSVLGENVTEVVYWTPIYYPVTFTESGLSGGTQWNVTIAGQELQSSSSSIKFELQNGTYSYVISSINGTFPSPSSGNMTVDGFPITVLVRFAVIVNVTFLISGLPSGAKWGILINNSTYYSTNPLIYVNLRNSTYSYKVIVPFNYYSSPAKGEIAGSGFIFINASSFLPWEVLIAIVVIIGIYFSARIRKARSSSGKQQQK